MLELIDIICALCRRQIRTINLDFGHVLYVWQRVLWNKCGSGLDPSHRAVLPDHVPGPHQLPGELCSRPCGGGENGDRQGAGQCSGAIYRNVPVFHGVRYQRHGKNRTGNSHGKKCKTVKVLS